MEDKVKKNLAITLVDAIASVDFEKVAWSIRQLKKGGADLNQAVKTAHFKHHFDYSRYYSDFGARKASDKAPPILDFAINQYYAVYPDKENQDIYHDSCKIIALLIREGAAVNTFFREKTPMMLALNRDMPLDIIQLLADAGADIYTNQEYGDIFFIACQKPDDILNFFIARYKADNINFKDIIHNDYGLGQTAYHILINAARISALFEVVPDILTNESYHVNKRTALMHCCESYLIDEDAIFDMVKRGADLFQKNSEGISAMDILKKRLSSKTGGGLCSPYFLAFLEKIELERIRGALSDAREAREENTVSPGGLGL